MSLDKSGEQRAEHPFMPSVELLRSLEACALALGRLDAAANTVEVGVQELLALRAAATVDVDRQGIIAILRADGEGGGPAMRLASVFHDGIVRSRTGSAPTLRWVGERLEVRGTDDVDGREFDESLRTLRSDGGTVLAALRAGRIMAEHSPLAAAAMIPLVLVHGGVLAGPWCTLSETELARPGRDLSSLATLLAARARDAEAAVGLAHAAMRAHEAAIDAAYGRAAHGAIMVLRSFRRWPLLDIPAAARRLRCTRPTVSAAIDRLEALGFVRELTGRGRDRVWCYSALADALSGAAGTAAGTASGTAAG